MRRRGIVTILLFLVALGLSCSKKQAGPAAEQPKDEVSSVPAVAERATDMTPVTTPLAGAVKEVKAKVMDKAADDAAKALIHLKVLALDGPVDVSDSTKVEFWKPGADPEEQKPDNSIWANHEEAVSPGTWDLRLLYDEGNLCKADGWIRNVTFTAGKLWKAEAVLAAPMQYVRLAGSIKGEDVADNMHVDFFKPNADQEEVQPLLSFWSTQKQAIAAGSYDLRLTYDKDNVKAKAAVKGFAVGTNHGILKHTVELIKE